MINNITNSENVRTNGVKDAQNLHLPYKSLKDGWADFIRQFEPYDWFTTLTFKADVHPDTADRQYHKWIRKLNKTIYGNRYYKKGLGVFHARAIELQKRGVIHFHALIKGVPANIHRIYFEQVWEKQHQNNGFANTYPYDPELGACGYLAKYMSKGGDLMVFPPPNMTENLPRLNLN